MPLQSTQFYMGMILIRFQFLINVNSISIISWVLLSISITISITKTGPYQYQYIINFSKFSLSISMPISILHFFLINISLSMHCAPLVQFKLWDVVENHETYFYGVLIAIQKNPMTRNNLSILIVVKKCRESSIG